MSSLSRLPSTSQSASGSAEPTRTKRKATHACARCRANQKGCQNGVSPAQAQALNIPTKACDRCSKSGAICTWDDVDHRHVFKSRDAVSMEAQIERLQRENAILRSRLEEHGISAEVGDQIEPPEAGARSDDDEPEESSERAGKHVGEVWYGGPSPFKDGEEGSTEALPTTATRTTSPTRSDPESDAITYQLCRTAAEVQALDPNTADDWLRYLPGDTISLLSRLEHDKALENFFSFFSNWQLRVVPHLFLRDFALAIRQNRSSRPPVTQHFSPMTHNAILSVALAYSDNEHLRSFEVREKFAKHAKRFLEKECRSATLSTVQGLAVLSSFHSGFAEQSLGFMYFGMSVRIAQALGLHVSAGTPRDKTNGATLEERDYVFWSLLAQDKCWSLYVGRDQGIRSGHCDVADATIITEMDASPWIWSYEPNQPAFEQPSYLSHSFVQQVQLMRISAAILDVVYSMKSSSRRGGLNIGRVNDIYLQLRSWEAKLPRQLHIADTSVRLTRAPPHIMMINLAYHWLVILLLRPLFRPGMSSSTSANAISSSPSASTTEGHAKKTLQTLREAAASQCPASANQIVRLFDRYDVLYGLRFSPITAPQIAYTAGQLHLGMYFAATTPSTQEKSRAMVKSCIATLEKMGKTWVSGKVTAGILRRLLENGERRMPSLESAPRIAPQPTLRPSARKSPSPTQFSQAETAFSGRTAPMSPSGFDAMDYTSPNEGVQHVSLASMPNFFLAQQPSGMPRAPPITHPGIPIASTNHAQDPNFGGAPPAMGTIPSWLMPFLGRFDTDAPWANAGMSPSDLGQAFQSAAASNMLMGGGGSASSVDTQTGYGSPSSLVMDPNAWMQFPLGGPDSMMMPPQAEESISISHLPSNAYLQMDYQGHEQSSSDFFSSTP